MMRDEILPYQRSKGMIIINTSIYSSDDGFDYFIWLREFDNAEAREKVYKNTYNKWWATEMKPKIFKLIDKTSINVKLLQAVNL
ncbi:hypothetical protein [Piscirickettsia salmonis]|uniref:hypothetical protein n=1 Tax=Piscirickettsia salmonis TaxID=1238 RepID=UPI003A80FE49